MKFVFRVFLFILLEKLCAHAKLYKCAMRLSDMQKNTLTGLRIICICGTVFVIIFSNLYLESNFTMNLFILKFFRCRVEEKNASPTGLRHLRHKLRVYDVVAELPD